MVSKTSLRSAQISSGLTRLYSVETQETQAHLELSSAKGGNTV